MNKTRFLYVTYISATPEKIWNALIDPDITKKYWQHENLSDWKPGSRWEHRSSEEGRSIDLVGRVVEYSPPRRLALSWGLPQDEDREKKQSRVTFDLELVRGVTMLTLTHELLEPGSDMDLGIRDGWPKVLSSLKSLLETGKPLPRL